MRQQLDIYASLVLCKSVPGFPTRHRDVDFAIIRENTEGEYSGLEHQVSGGEALEAGLRTCSARTDSSPRVFRTVLPWRCRVAQDHDPGQV